MTRSSPQRGLLTATDRQLLSTAITPHVQQRILPGQNLLWCGTFQLAWNETAGLIGEELHFDAEPPVVAELNRGPSRRMISMRNPTWRWQDSCEMASSTRSDGPWPSGSRAGRLRHYLPPRALTPRPQDIVAYSYLFKHLEFAVPFEDLVPAPPVRRRRCREFRHARVQARPHAHVRSGSHPGLPGPG